MKRRLQPAYKFRKKSYKKLLKYNKWEWIKEQNKIEQF